MALVLALAGCAAPNSAYELPQAPVDAAGIDVSADGANADGPGEATGADAPRETAGADAPRETTGADAPRDTGRSETNADAARVADSASTGPTTPPISCPTDSELVACFRFENQVRDESATALAVPVANNLKFESGPDSLALSLTPQSLLRSESTGKLDALTLTVEVWLKMRTFPTGTARAAVVDYQSNFSIFVLPGGGLTCGFHGGKVQVDGAIRLGVWTSIACTVDSTTIAVWQDGLPRQSQAFTGLSRPTTDGPLAIGGNIETAAEPNPDPFDGNIDNLRIWRRVRSSTEICQSALACTH